MQNNSPANAKRLKEISQNNSQTKYQRNRKRLPEKNPLKRNSTKKKKEQYKTT